MIKKILTLLILFIVLISYTIFNFSYNDLKEDNDIYEFKNFKENLYDNYFNFKNFIIETITNKKINIIKTNTSFTLTKINNQIVLDGNFSNQEQANELFIFLNINREGKYTFKNNIIINKNELKKLIPLVNILKDFFKDNSKIYFSPSSIKLEGELLKKTFKHLIEVKVKNFNFLTSYHVKMPGDIIVISNKKIINNNFFISDFQKQLNVLLNDKNYNKNFILSKEIKTLLNKTYNILKIKNNFIINISIFTTIKENINERKKFFIIAQKIKSYLVSLGIDKSNIKINFTSNKNKINSTNHKIKINFINKGL